MLSVNTSVLSIKFCLRKKQQQFAKLCGIYDHSDTGNTHADSELRHSQYVAAEKGRHQRAPSIGSDPKMMLFVTKFFLLLYFFLIHFFTPNPSPRSDRSSWGSAP